MKVEKKRKKEKKKEIGKDVDDVVHEGKTDKYVLMLLI